MQACICATLSVPLCFFRNQGLFGLNETQKATANNQVVNSDVPVSTEIKLEYLHSHSMITVMWERKWMLFICYTQVKK